eukprot:1260983-Alexandrium_andersonii.AAC.1
MSASLVGSEMCIRDSVYAALSWAETDSSRGFPKPACGSDSGSRLGDMARVALLCNIRGFDP